MSKIKLTYEESHKEVDGILYKLCNKCNEWFPCTDEYFYKNSKNSLDGLFPYCKECNKEKIYDWRENNPEKHKVLYLRRGKLPKEVERVRRVAKEQRENGYQKEYQQSNKDKIKEYGERRRSKNHDITKEEWEHCKEYFNYSCAYCGISEEQAKLEQGQNLHKEHVIYDGINDLSNCVPSCKSCNCKKWTFSLEDWYKKDNPIYHQQRHDKIIKWLNEDYKKSE